MASTGFLSVEIETTRRLPGRLAPGAREHLHVAVNRVRASHPDLTVRRNEPCADLDDQLACLLVDFLRFGDDNMDDVDRQRAMVPDDVRVAGQRRGHVLHLLRFGYVEASPDETPIKASPHDRRDAHGAWGGLRIGR